MTPRTTLSFSSTAARRAAAGASRAPRGLTSLARGRRRASRARREPTAPLRAWLRQRGAAPRCVSVRRTLLSWAVLVVNGRICVHVLKSGVAGLLLGQRRVMVHGLRVWPLHRYHRPDQLQRVRSRALLGSRSVELRGVRRGPSESFGGRGVGGVGRGGFLGTKTKRTVSAQQNQVV
jgi:hypothetical protein